MFASTVCPCCKQNLPEGKRILFFETERRMAWSGNNIHLTPLELRLMKLLDKSAMDTSALVERAYSNDANGGPETANNSVRVTISRLRKKLKPLGLKIEASGFGRAGDGVYSLVRE